MTRPEFTDCNGVGIPAIKYKFPRKKCKLVNWKVSRRRQLDRIGGLQ